MRSGASLDIELGKNCLTKILQFPNISLRANQRKIQMTLTPQADTIKVNIYPYPRLPHFSRDVLGGLGLLSSLSFVVQCVRSGAICRRDP